MLRVLLVVVEQVNPPPGPIQPGIMPLLMVLGVHAEKEDLCVDARWARVFRWRQGVFGRSFMLADEIVRGRRRVRFGI